MYDYVAHYVKSYGGIYLCFTNNNHHVFHVLKQVIVDAIFFETEIVFKILGKSILAHLMGIICREILEQ